MYNLDKSVGIWPACDLKMTFKTKDKDQSMILR